MNKFLAIITAYSLFAVFLPSLTLSGAKASETDVVDVKITKNASSYRFDVTLRHADTGWDHYAKQWQIIGPDGTVLGTRILAHPHVDEQPFTRSLGGVIISDSINQVTIRAVDNFAMPGGASMKIDLPE